MHRNDVHSSVMNNKKFEKEFETKYLENYVAAFRHTEAEYEQHFTLFSLAQ